MSRRFWITLLSLAALILGSPLRLSAVELRTTVAGRPICRTVDCKAAVAQKELPVCDPIEVLGCPACGVAGCDFDCVQPCGYWAKLEYLLWWRRGRALPPLVTTGDPNDFANAGALGLDSTEVLFGGETLGEDARPGGRVTIGMWLDGCACHAVAGRFYALGRETVRFNIQAEPTDFLARPFTDTSGPNRLLVNDTMDLLDGRIDITSRSEVLGGDVVFRRLLCSSACWDVDLLAGYQFARIDEDLVISDSRLDSSDPFLGPVVVGFNDLFLTKNEYHAGQIGIEAAYHGPCWRVDLLSNVSFGNMNQIVDISGQTVVDGVPTPNSDGLLANSGNMGRHQQDEFAVATELGATLVYQLHECFDLSLGYTYIYFSDVVQPGEQIDPSLAVPSSFQFNTSSYWLHGLRIGGELRF